MEAIVFDTGISLLEEARKVKEEFLKCGTNWSFEACLDAVIETERVVTNVDAINSARIVAKEIDKKEEEAWRMGNPPSLNSFLCIFITLKTEYYDKS